MLIFGLTRPISPGFQPDMAPLRHVREHIHEIWRILKTVCMSWLYYLNASQLCNIHRPLSCFHVPGARRWSFSLSLACLHHFLSSILSRSLCNSHCLRYTYVHFWEPVGCGSTIMTKNVTAV